MTTLREQTILSLEGATLGHSVALLRQGEALGEIYLAGAKNASETLLASIETLLADCSVAKEELQGIVVGIGPGSFTSIRISLSTAEGLGLALGLPLYGMSSLHGMAAGLSHFDKGRVWVAQNAYKGELYLGRYDCSGPFPEELEEPSLITPQALFERLQAGDLLMGTGIKVLKKKGLDPMAKGVILEESPARRPSALHMAAMILDQEARTPSPLPLEPLYIRPSEAEINYKRNFGLD